MRSEFCGYGELRTRRTLAGRIVGPVTRGLSGESNPARACGFGPSGLRARDRLTVIRTDGFGLGRGRRLALAATMALVGWAGTAGGWAQVVKAPRYSGGLEAPAPQLNLPPLPPAITPHGEVVEDVVARVNDQIISRSDVERAEQQLVNDAQQNHMSASDLAMAQAGYAARHDRRAALNI